MENFETNDSQVVQIKKDDNVKNDNKSLFDKQLEKQKRIKKQKQKDKYKREKDNYFSYYDDIKVGSHKIVDW